MHAESFFFLSVPPSICRRNLYDGGFSHSEKLFKVHILCQREVKGEMQRVVQRKNINNWQHYLFKLQVIYLRCV